MKTLAWTSWIVAVASIGCGGKAVVDGMGAEGGGGSTSTGTTNTSVTTITTVTTTVTTTGANCSDHSQCPGGLCVFSTGLCSEACSPSQSCGIGWYCDSCGTSSCPQCYDCVSACLPAASGQCDDHDDCASPNLCIYWQQQCAPPCDDESGCADPNLYCDFCATASCPMCADCLPACVYYGMD